jgi:hypothetical protein
MACVCLDEETGMVGLDRQGAYLPVMLIRYFTEHLLQPIRNLVFEHIRSPLRAPHEVILHRAGGAVASAVWFFIGWHHSTDKLSCPVFRVRSLTLRSTFHCACPDYCRGRSPEPTGSNPPGATAPLEPEGFSKSTPPGQRLLRASSIL